MVFTYVNPAVAVVLGVAFLGERFGLATAVGFVLILVGSFLATGSRLSPGLGGAGRHRRRALKGPPAVRAPG